MLVLIFRLMIQITNSQPSTLSHAGKNVRFLHSAFDNNGDSFVAGDHQGHIFLFDITKNRYRLVFLYLIRNIDIISSTLGKLSTNRFMCTILK